MNSARVPLWLASYAFLTRFPSISQPGFDDPQLHAALTVIANEHDAIDRIK